MNNIEILRNFVIYLNPKSLNTQKEFYLSGNFQTSDIQLANSTNENSLSYYLANCKEPLIELVFFSSDNYTLTQLFKYTVKQAFDYAKNLSNEPFDWEQLDLFFDSVMLNYNNYISYIEQDESKQNTFDLLVYIVSCLVKKHILINGNKRSIFSFVVVFLRNFCGLYLKWTKSMHLDDWEPEIQKSFQQLYADTMSEWVEKSKSENLDLIIKEFIIKNSIIWMG
ncbi:hypothetical protein NPA08_01980 [Mycoplasmopsis citelli]|uniref:Fido domain-containing protein n=1 Tax=Mycoplasmopsis citelli TaxID=171281 RepID=A0A449B0W3_9BACT|nr:hypothetical protein [Mycoplasmopsis citelli]UUD36580.1 hypothetical protein NPA08_01980 [Mycoplasmopsis citelli]VEU74216.1 Uncharacterised protein [Mycoplasmopsis citelli]